MLSGLSAFRALSEVVFTFAVLVYEFPSPGVPRDEVGVLFLVNCLRVGGYEVRWRLLSLVGNDLPGVAWGVRYGVAIDGLCYLAGERIRRLSFVVSSKDAPSPESREVCRGNG